MLNDTFWAALFSQLAEIITWAKSTPAVSFTYDGTTYNLTWFMVWVSFIVVSLLIDVLLWFNKKGEKDDD